MAFRLSLIPVLLLVVLLILSPSQTTQSTALVIAEADDNIAVEDDSGLGVDDEDYDDEDYGDDVYGDADDEDDDDQAEQPADPPADPDKPAVIDPEGEENATGYQLPDTSAASFFDGFQDGLDKWVQSTLSQYNGLFKVGQGAKPTFKGDRALIIPEKARHYGLSAEVSGFEDMSGKDMVLQYEVKLDQGMTCGGAYLKLPTTGFEPATMDGSTTYSIMFGPDKCGATDKVHFIFQSKNPVSGKMVEHHLKDPPTVANSYDKKTHLYTISVKSDGKFELYVDNELKKDGTLSDSFEPPIQPLKEIDDPEDKKPSDWVDEAKIADPEATKPDDWDENAPKTIADKDAEKPEGWLDDEPEMIPDPETNKPEEWDDEEDGEWEAPKVANPKCEAVGCGKWKRPMKENPDYKGKWSAPMIDNPAYKGEWKPRKITNEEYYEVSNPSLLPIMGLGFEIWTMDQGVLFDNIWLGHDIAAAKKFAEATFSKKQKTEIERDEAETAKREAEAKKKGKSTGKTDGKLGAVMEMVEGAVEKLEELLEPVEAWLIQVGAEPYLDMLIDRGIQKPMIVVVFAPLVAVLLFLTILGGKGGRASPSEESTASVAEKKKTDAPTADVKGAGEESTPVAEVQDISETQPSDAGTSEKNVRRRRTATAE